MKCLGIWLLLALGGALLPAAPADDNVTFRSDVSLVRVDAQVLDRDNRAVTGMRAEDFVLREEGRVQPIRNFSSENMPVDVLLLFDVSASMRPHVQRIASAAHQALSVLGETDRVGIMVFDRTTRVRLSMRSSRSEVERELENMLRQETFRGGTDITRALLDAAAYVGREGRKDARRAIVILTDDMTEFDRDEASVSRALTRADAVLSALIAPDAVGNRGYGGGRRGGGGGGYPGGGGGGGRNGGGIGGGLGGVIFGPPGGYGGGGGRRGGGGYPGGGSQGGGSQGGGGNRTKSAGTSEIARDSGGDSLPVDDASALETTLSRIRQRYALHFLVPAGARSGQERHIEVALSDTARSRYADAEIRYRHTYVAPNGLPESGPADATATSTGNSDPVLITPDSSQRKRRAISEPEGSRGPSTGPLQPDTSDSDSGSGKWRKVKPGEQP